MPDYRFFFVAWSGRIESAPTYVTLPGDLEAMMRGTQLVTPSIGVEIWDADRLVCRIPATKEVARAAPSDETQITASDSPTGSTAQGMGRAKPSGTRTTQQTERPKLPAHVNLDDSF